MAASSTVQPRSIHAHTFDNGTSFTGAGVVEFANASPGYTFAGDISASNVTISNGTFTLATAKTFTVTGANSSWSGGTITGAGTIKVNVGAALAITGATGKVLNSSLENRGSVTWTGVKPPSRRTPL